MLNGAGLGIGFIFEAVDRTGHAVHQVKDGLREVRESAEHTGFSVGNALGMAGTAIFAVGAAAVAAAGGAFALAEHAENFSQAIRQAGVMSHSTAAQMQELQEAALHAGLDSLRGNAITSAETLAELAKEGMNAAGATAALGGTLTLMRVGSLDARDAAGLVHDSLAQFGMGAGQAGELTDKLAFAMKNFGFRAEELRGTMSGLAAGAQLTSASLDDTLIGVGLIKEVFPSATKAAMSMNAAMQQLASPRAQKELASIGVRVTDTTGRIRPLVDIIGQLAGRTERMTESQIAHRLETIAGGRAAGGLSAIIDGLRKGVADASGHMLTGAAAIAYLREELANTSGTAKKMSSLLGDDMGGSLKALGSALSNLGVVLGESFESPFKRAFQAANLFIRGITQLFSQGGFSGEVKDALDEHLGIKHFAIGVFTWVERIKNYFRSWVDGFQAAFAPFRPVLDQLMVGFRQLGQALGLVDQTADQNASVWDSLAGYGRSVGEVFGALAGTVLPVVVTAIDLVTEGIREMRVAFATVGPVLAPLYQGIKGVFGLIGGLLTGDWKAMWDGFIDVVSGAAMAITNLIMGALGHIAGLVDSVGSALGHDFGLQRMVSEAQSFVNSGVAGGVGVAKGLVQGAPGQPAATAVAAIQAQAVASAAAGPGIGAPGGDQVVHVHVPLSVDGEKFAEAHATAKRSARARSFVPVAAAGGF